MHVVATRLAAPRIGPALRATPAGNWLLEGAQFIYFVGVPYLALLTGAFAPSDVGLQGSPTPDLLVGWTAQQWVRGFGQAVALGLLTLAFVLVLAGQIRRAGGHAPAAMGADDAPPTSGRVARAIRDGIYAEAHWSFYRALPIVLGGDAGRAALLGITLAAAEALLTGRRAASSVSRITLSGALLGMSSATFFALTGGNFWIAAVLQAATRISLARTAHARQTIEPLDEIIV